MTKLLDQAEITSQLGQLDGWTLEGKKIKSIRKFKDFIEAINFVNQLVEPAEAAGHHPDLEISYNKVTIYLTTHDAGGITDNDISLAKAINQI